MILKYSNPDIKGNHKLT